MIYGVFFYDRRGLDWWDAFTRPGFRHCGAAVCDGNMTLTIEFTEGCIVPAAYPLTLAELAKSQNRFSDFRRYVAISADLLDKAPQSRITIIPPGSVMSCVSVTKAFLGVYWPGVLTPYQLYRKLRKCGGTEYGCPVQQAQEKQGAGSRPASAGTANPGEGTQREAGF